MGNLEGVTFCFTGPARHKRAELIKMAEQAGAGIKTSVVKGLTYLVEEGDGTSVKSLKANRLGVEVISEDRFLEMVGHGNCYCEG